MVLAYKLQGGVFYALPTGDRPQKALAVVRAWKDVGITVVAYCWDDETYNLLKDVTPYLFRGERKSFPVLQNLMAKQVTGWECMICGADDLYPHNLSQLEDTYKKFPGKILWVDDNITKFNLTHPVVTRQWYDNHDEIFDEQFTHCYCDRELYVQASRRGEIVKCFNIVFDHRHYLVTGEPLDKINKIAEAAREKDKERFYSKYKDTNSYLGFVETYRNK